MSRELLTQILDVLEDLQGGCTDSDDGTVEAITVYCPELITAIRAALDAPDEPAAYLYRGGPDKPDALVWYPDPPHTTPLYATPERAPVAWMHNMIAGVVVPHRPADLNRHPERWTALVPIKTQLLGE